MIKYIQGIMMQNTNHICVLPLWWTFVISDDMQKYLSLENLRHFSLLERFESIDRELWWRDRDILWVFDGKYFVTTSRRSSSAPLGRYTSLVNGSTASHCQLRSWRPWLVASPVDNWRHHRQQTIADVNICQENYKTETSGFCCTVRTVTYH